MKIVILTVDHVYSNKVLNFLISRFGRDISLIIEPSEQLKGKSNMQAVLMYIKKSGAYYVAAQVVRLLLYKFLSQFTLNKKSKFYSFRKSASENNIAVKKVKDINSPNSINMIKKAKPDLIVSVLFSQILKKDVIKIPGKGVINLHPAYLPYFKGISPVFWALVNKEKCGGVTVHYINEGIDTGNIISRKKIEIVPQDTEDSLYFKCIQVGAKLLSKAISDISLNHKPKLIKNKGGTYYSFPTKEAVKKFQKDGRSFFKLRDYLRN